MIFLLGLLAFFSKKYLKNRNRNKNMGKALRKSKQDSECIRKTQRRGSSKFIV
tara:strand:- start:99 stop:257 length:159 start_codon:yes stop_codon:yes gene_type:complete